MEFLPVMIYATCICLERDCRCCNFLQSLKSLSKVEMDGIANLTTNLVAKIVPNTIIHE